MVGWLVAIGKIDLILNTLLLPHRYMHCMHVCSAIFNVSRKTESIVEPTELNNKHRKQYFVPSPQELA